MSKAGWRDGQQRWLCAEAMRQKQRRHYERNPEHVRARRRARYLLTRERELERHRRWVQQNAELQDLATRRWREGHAERVRETQRRWRQTNKEHVAAAGLEWSRANSARRVASEKRRQARKRGLKSDLTIEQWYGVLAEFNDRCAYCGGAGTTQDHDMPLSRGGAHSRSNVLPACQPCNFGKATRSGSEWVLTLLSRAATYEAV